MHSGLLAEGGDGYAIQNFGRRRQAANSQRIHGRFFTSQALPRRKLPTEKKRVRGLVDLKKQRKDWRLD